MPRKRLTMRKIREVLRLKAAGLNIREVAEGTGSARTTVYEYLVRAEGAGLSWPLPEDLDDEALEARLFPPATAELARRRPVPDWREVHRELRSGQARDAAAVVAGVETSPPRRLGLQPVLRPLRALARRPGRRHAAQLPRRGEDVRRLQRRQGAASSTRAPARWPRPRSSWPCSAARGCSTSRRRRTRGYRAGSWPTCTPSRPMAAPRWRPRPII